jgi:hypothetical protein
MTILYAVAAAAQLLALALAADDGSWPRALVFGVAAACSVTLLVMDLISARQASGSH